MKKKELIKKVVKKTKGLLIKDVEQVLTALPQVIIEELKNGEEKVILTKLGHFHLVQLQARQVVNPRTQQKMWIPARKILKFKRYKKAIKKINAN